MLSGPDHPNSHGLFLAPCTPRYVSAEFLSKNQENRPSFQSTHFTRKSPHNLLRLKLEIVNTMNIGLMLRVALGLVILIEIQLCEVK